MTTETQEEPNEALHDESKQHIPDDSAIDGLSVESEQNDDNV